MSILKRLNKTRVRIPPAPRCKSNLHYLINLKQKKRKMKKTIIALCAVVGILTSCGGADTNTEASAADSLKVDTTKVVVDSVATADTATLTPATVEVGVEK